jgi:hypothetical protein
MAEHLRVVHKDARREQIQQLRGLRRKLEALAGIRSVQFHGSDGTIVTVDFDLVAGGVLELNKTVIIDNLDAQIKQLEFEIREL